MLLNIAMIMSPMVIMVDSKLLKESKQGFSGERVDFIKRWVSTCIIQRRKSPGAKPKAKLSTYLVGSIGERVNTDLIGPFSETDKGNSWILCIGDLFSKHYVCLFVCFLFCFP